MSKFDFYISHLRFVAKKTERASPEVELMMAELTRIADEIESTDGFSVEFDQTRIAGRGLAGVAGFLQQHILPEVVDAGNQSGERQIRWVIDTSMAMMATLTVHAETSEDEGPCKITLPSPPLLN